MKYAKALILSALVGGMTLANPISAGNNITPGLQSVDIMHKGKMVSISRSADKEAKIPEAFAKVSRHCPPFCIQPAKLDQGVDTVGELEVLGYLKRLSNGDRTLLVVDSRTPEWIMRGTIPGSVNIPWNKINVDVEGSFEVAAEADTLEDILKNQFGARLVDGKWDFRNAKTLILFCNGSWCPQSGANIKTLLSLGYPAYKLKWYRGGMQDWVSVGLTTVKN
ncbi:MAG: rhodanese-like domain-containing protein [Gammaproteobacteria bacterium]|nr:rhodanese-like domain-containing protein [Gammaproteobacteria bacterium]